MKHNTKLYKSKPDRIERRNRKLKNLYLEISKFPLSITDRTTRQKISKIIQKLQNTIN